MIYSTSVQPHTQFEACSSPFQKIQKQPQKGWSKHYLISLTHGHFSNTQSYPTPQPLLKMRTALLTLRPPPSPCLSSSTSPKAFLFNFRPNKRFYFLSPCSSLKQTKKQTLQKSTSGTPNTPPQSLKWLFNNSKNDDKNGGDAGDEEGGLEGDTAIKGTVLAGLLLVGVVGGFGTAGYIYKDQINAFLNQFSTFIEGNNKKTEYPFEGLC